MRTQLQAVSLRLQTLRSNEQMAQAMKGATRVSISPLSPVSIWSGKANRSAFRQGHAPCTHIMMNTMLMSTRFILCPQAMSLMSRTMNLPQISKILQDFERESSAMDMKEEMMSDTIDDVMEDEGETEEEESDKILKQVLDEIGVSVSQQVSVISLSSLSSPIGSSLVACS